MGAHLQGTNTGPQIIVINVYEQNIVNRFIRHAGNHGSIYTHANHTQQLRLYSKKYKALKSLIFFLLDVNLFTMLQDQ